MSPSDKEKWNFNLKLVCCYDVKAHFLCIVRYLSGEKKKTHCGSIVRKMQFPE